MGYKLIHESYYYTDTFCVNKDDKNLRTCEVVYDILNPQISYMVITSFSRFITNFKIKTDQKKQSEMCLNYLLLLDLNKLINVLLNNQNLF